MINKIRNIAMKKITVIFLSVGLALLTACEGVPGPPGQDGEDGLSLLGSVFNYSGDFTPQNDYQLFFTFPASYELYESDVILVYILWEQTTDNNGDPLDIWRLLPQTVVLNEGVLQYNYDHTFGDVRIFLEGTLDLNDLNTAETIDQRFRIVVLPADYAKSNDLDISNYNQIIRNINPQINPIVKH